MKPGPYGDKRYVTRIYLCHFSINLPAFSIVNLSFVVVSSGKLNVPTTKIYSKCKRVCIADLQPKIVTAAAAAQSNDPTEKFEFSGDAVAVTSYTFQPRK